mgnify:CR=1 FL=1
MEYSPYTKEQIMNNDDYQNLCNHFLKLANNEEEKNILKSILYNGGYNNYTPNGQIGRDNPKIEIIRRAGLAYLFLEHPETFRKLIENNITYFHGTNCNALPNILKYGLNSVDESLKKGIDIKTGESWSRINGKRDYISFTDVLNIAREYSMTGGVRKNELLFPIVFGTTKDEITKSVYTSTIQSYLPEVGIIDNLPLKSIKCIMVPEDKVKIIKKMTDENILVLAANSITNQFYNIDIETGRVYINEEKYNDFKERKKEKIEIYGIKETVSKTKVSTAKNIIKILNNLIKGEQNDEHKRNR